MCHNRGLNDKIDNIHKRPLRIVYQHKIKFRGFTTEGQICVYPHKKLTVFGYRNL